MKERQVPSQAEVPMVHYHPQLGFPCSCCRGGAEHAACPTLRVFSNWELMRVIMPMEAMKERRLRTCVMPRRSMRKRLMVQLPLLMALSSPAVMMSVRMQRLMSKSSCLFALLSTVSACAHGPVTLAPQHPWVGGLACSCPASPSCVTRSASHAASWVSNDVQLICWLVQLLACIIIVDVGAALPQAPSSVVSRPPAQSSMQTAAEYLMARH